MKRTGNSLISAALFFLLFLLIFPEISKAQDEEDTTPVKIDTLLYTIPLTVSDKKGSLHCGVKEGKFHDLRRRFVAAHRAFSERGRADERRDNA
jgi:hypothetical protein